MRKNSLTALALLLSACAASRPASAAALIAPDEASLQFTVPAPDPVQAGDTLSIQALAVNTGASSWAAGSYYWVAEVYDVEYRFLTRTDQISPGDTVPPGGIAAVTLPFQVPATATGRRFYRVYLVKDNHQLLESDYKAFQILEKVIPPAPEAVDYRMEGNVTVSMKDASTDHWGQPYGSEVINLSGKLKDSSYLLNANLINETGNVVDPYSLLFNYYAPWGKIFAGDISPVYSQLSINGLGLRGGMLEQSRGIFDWSALGGESVTSQAGTAQVNGRYERSIYAGRFGVTLPGGVKIGVDAFQSADEVGSLSSDPESNNYRGPTLTAQENSGMGLTAAWKPVPKASFMADYQKNSYTADTSIAPVADTAGRFEFRWDGTLLKFKTYAQRTGANFVAFGAPSVIGDRMTYDADLGVFPAKWYTLNLSGNQYTDNLADDPTKLTTTQRILNAGNVLHFNTGTDFNVSGSLNTAKGKTASALNNQTVTEGVALTQAIKKNTVSLNVQDSQFHDFDKIADNLDTQTLGLNVNLSLPGRAIGSLGETTSSAKDKTNGSTRDTQSTSASYSRPLWPQWTGQLFGSLTTTKNTSTQYPADTSTLSINSEFTWNIRKQVSVAFGLGYNRTEDKVAASNDVDAIVLSTRYSYSF